MPSIYVVRQARRRSITKSVLSRVRGKSGKIRVNAVRPLSDLHWHAYPLYGQPEKRWKPW